MTTKSIRERINEDERHGSKESFNSDYRGFKSTRSCYVCFTENPKLEGLTVRVLGRSEFFCSLECKEGLLKSTTSAIA